MKPGDLIDRYRVERLIGQGGMAAVYEVRHTILGNAFALKVLDPRLAEDPDIRDRFLGEGRIQAQLQHDHIVRVLDVVAVPGIAGLVMELVVGEGLDAHLAEVGRPLPMQTIQAILLPVTEAVGYAHGKGVVHRDLKPENIVLRARPDGRPDPVVLDFGVAKIAAGGGVAPAPKQQTRQGSPMGTLAYMAPEQVKDAADVDARADVYALGAILYEMATGELAFAGHSDYAVMQNIVQGNYPAPGPRMVHPDPGLEACIARALAVDRDHRTPDCASFARMLVTPSGATPRSVSTPPVGPGTMTSTPPAPSPVTSTPPHAPAPAPSMPPTPAPVVDRSLSAGAGPARGGIPLGTVAMTAAIVVLLGLAAVACLGVLGVFGPLAAWLA